MTIITMFAFLLLMFLPTESVVLEDIAKFTEVYSVLANDDGNLVVKFEELKAGVQELNSLSGPVGALVASGFNATFDPDSEERQGLSQLHRLMKVFKNSKQLPKRDEYGTSIEKFQDDYTKNVMMPLENALIYYKWVTNPKVKSSHHNAQFMRSCEQDVPSILTFMRQRIVENCPLPAKEDMAFVKRLCNIFQDIERNIEDEEALVDFAEYSQMKEALLPNEGGMSPARKDYIINRLEQVRATSTEELERQLKHLKLKKLVHRFMYLNNFNRCPFEVIGKLSSHAKVALNQESQQVYTDLVKIAGVAPMCGNIIHNGDQNGIDLYLKNSTTEINEISQFMSQWLSNFMAGCCNYY